MLLSNITLEKMQAQSPWASASNPSGNVRSVHLQVSRVLKLPIPAKSTQLLGKDFVGEEGRGANLVNIGNGAVVVRAACLAHERLALNHVLSQPLFENYI